jgi:hypothetical protein
MFSFRSRRRSEPPAPPVDNESPARKFIRKMHSVAAPFTGSRTVVLYGKNCLGVPHILGTGVPVSAGGIKFVVTAAHTLDTHLRKGRGIYLSPGVQGGKLISLANAAVHGSAMPKDGDRVKDLFDLRVVRLTDDAVAELGGETEFVGLGLFDIDEGRNGSYYFLHGFPSGSVRVNYWRRSFLSESFPYGTIIYHGQRGAWDPGLPEVMIDLDFDPE